MLLGWSRQRVVRLAATWSLRSCFGISLKGSFLPALLPVHLKISWLAALKGTIIRHRRNRSLQPALMPVDRKIRVHRLTALKWTTVWHFRKSSFEPALVPVNLGRDGS